MCLKKTAISWQTRKVAKLLNIFLTLLLLGTLTLNPLLYSCSCISDDRKTIEVCFTPGGRCIYLIEKAIAEAHEEILVQAYYFTSNRIAKALIAAHLKGVTVKILVDRSQLIQRGSQLKKLSKNGIIIFIDKVTGVAHNKVMVIDDKYVLTGSYNWTHNAEYKNAENLLLIYDKHTNRIYRQNWEQRVQQSTNYLASGY